VNPAVLTEIAEDFLPLSALHHAVLVVVMVMVWMRRETMTRVVDVYFALAFATAAFALATRPETWFAAPVAAALAALWVRDAVHPELSLSFRRTPRIRLVIMVLLGAFGFGYPGYSGELPSAFFAPLGVILPPTVIVALAILNSAWPQTSRILHWALAGTGLTIGGVGMAAEGWIHAPVVAASVYAVVLLSGRGKLTEARDTARERSVREIRDRMYARKTILPGPRDPRRRRPRVRRRRR